MNVKEAIRVLRQFALEGPESVHPDVAAIAIDALDNADVFVGHDGEGI